MAQRYGYRMPGSDEQPPAAKEPGEAETLVLTGSVTSYAERRSRTGMRR